MSANHTKIDVLNKTVCIPQPEIDVIDHVPYIMPTVFTKHSKKHIPR